MKKILFICTGNTCRSPMAAGLFNMMAQDRSLQGFTAGSAGLAAMPGDEAAPNAITAAGELGADISGHRSRAYNPHMADEADLLVCMTPAHAELLKDVPDEKKIILAGGVPDPYGGSLEEYRLCAKKIIEGLEELFPLL